MVTPEYFQPTRGLFQGNPISSTGFTLVSELFAHSLRMNKHIEGIKIGEITHLLSMFADDVAITAMNKLRVGQEIEWCIRHFEQISGLKVNYDKSTVYRMGSACDANAQQYILNKIKWSDKPVNLLGVTITDDSQEIEKLNTGEFLKKIESITSTWSYRGLSLMGKILVINTLIASLMIYKITCITSLKK